MQTNKLTCKRRVFIDLIVFWIWAHLSGVSIKSLFLKEVPHCPSIIFRQGAAAIGLLLTWQKYAIGARAKKQSVLFIYSLFLSSLL